MPRTPRLVLSDTSHSASNEVRHVGPTSYCMPVAILFLAAVCKEPITTPSMSVGVHKKVILGLKTKNYIYIMDP